MSRISRHTLIFVVCLIAFGSACQRSQRDSRSSLLSENAGSGTIWGNPRVQAARTVLESVCDVVTRCNSSVSLAQCTSAFSTTPGISMPLGLAAIEAIDAGASSNVVALPQGQITLALGSQLSISRPAEVYGDCQKPTTIDGNAASRVFMITSGPTRGAQWATSRSSGGDPAVHRQIA
jgi:hypothetical protein